MKCKFCGQELPEEAIYCNYCGKEVKDTCMSDKKDIDIKINSRLICILIFIMTACYCLDGKLDAEFIKSIKPFKSEKTISDTYDDAEVRKELEKYVTEQKETLPITISDGIIMIDVELDGKNIIITSELQGLQPSDCTQQMADDAKAQVLSSGVLDEKYGQLFREFEYGIIYSYVNEYNEPLYKIHIYPHEL